MAVVEDVTTSPKWERWKTQFLREREKESKLRRQIIYHPLSLIHKQRWFNLFRYGRGVNLDWLFALLKREVPAQHCVSWLFSIKPPRSNPLEMLPFTWKIHYREEILFRIFPHHFQLFRDVIWDNFKWKHFSKKREQQFKLDSEIPTT